MPSSPDVIFKSLADPTRRAIFEHLCRKGEQNVRALTEYAGVSQPAVSKHLTVLKQAGLVRDRRDGRETHYNANPKGLTPAMSWMRHQASFWERHFDRLASLLERTDR
jgi:DNA-binding transcriptional ArsR family regulator